MAAEAATTLGAIAGAGGDISGAVSGLVSTLANREDAVSTASMHTIGMIGDSSHVSSLVAVLGDAKRSEAARTSAANALSGIFSRGASASAEDLTAISGVLKSDAAVGVRASAARALGSMHLDPEVRATMLHGLRMTKAQG